MRAPSLVLLLVAATWSSLVRAERPFPPDDGAARKVPVLQVAVDPPRPAPPAPPAPPSAPVREGDGAGPRLTFGRAFTHGVADGWFGRFETDYWEVRGLSIAGMLLGLEGWGSSEGGGGALTTSVYGGLRLPFGSKRRAPCLFTTVGFGVDWALYDKIRGDGGFGILAPLATGNLGMDFRGIRLLGDVRVEYRWLWDAPDRAQIRAGVTLNLDSELWDGPSG